MKNIFQKALTVIGMVVAAQVSYAQAWDPNLNTTDHTGRIGSVSVGTPLSVAGVKFLVSVNGANTNTAGVMGIVSNGDFGAVPTVPTATRWSGIGDRFPISTLAGVQTTGLRTQWDLYGINIGLVNRGIGNGSGVKDGIISWQDLTLNFPTTAAGSNNSSLRFIFRNQQTPNNPGSSAEYMTIQANGNTGIGVATPFVKLHVQGGNIAQVSSGFLGVPSSRWSALGANATTATGFASSVSGLTHNWNNRAFYAGLFESAGQRDGLIAWQDFSRTSAASNRLRIGSIIGTGSGANFTEHATVLSNGNVGLGTSTPNVRLAVEGPSLFNSNSNNVISITGITSNYIVIDGSQNSGNSSNRKGINIILNRSSSATTEYGVESRISNANSGTTGLYCGVAGIARYVLNAPAPGPGSGIFYGVYGEAGGSRTAINTTNGTGSKLLCNIWIGR